VPDAGLVLLATQVFSFHTPVAVAASTLTAAVLFNLPPSSTRSSACTGSHSDAGSRT
jgi:hypothetical protein